MKILITGACGFVGSRIASYLLEYIPNLELVGIDNLLRPGSEMNRRSASASVRILHGDIRMQSDVDSLPSCDWVIDAAANPSVLAGVDGKSSPRQLNEHNLLGTLNILEYCRARSAGLIVLSTSRVYSVRELASLPMLSRSNGFLLDDSRPLPTGVSPDGLAESFPVKAPVSLYGATKLASEVMALEYGSAFNFPVWVNRCGVLAGAGQFGTAEQGIFSYWLHAHAARRPLRYIGFGGHGWQVRDAMHPSDLGGLIARELQTTPPTDPVYNAGGGRENSMSLAHVTEWCNARFGVHRPVRDSASRPYDIPWVVMDTSKIRGELGWQPKVGIEAILEEIAEHVAANPDWLARSGTV